MKVMRAPCWAVVGPAGAGKSCFCGLLAERGARVIEADLVAHALLDRPDLQPRLVAVFGREILGRQGRIDRAILGPLVFADPQARRRLDSLVHPPLAAALSERLAAARSQRSPLVILEAAVYFLLPGPPPVDLAIAVTAPPAIRRERLIAKGLDPAVAEARIAAQAHLEPTWRLADRIIVNDGSPANLAALAADLWRDCLAP